MSSIFLWGQILRYSLVTFFCSFMNLDGKNPLKILTAGLQENLTTFLGLLTI